jgi:hypothetical protein
MSEKRKIPGQWWSPDKPDDKWIGTLTLAPAKSPRLKVSVPKSCFSLLETKAPPVIHGHDDQGKPVTLFFPSWPRTHGGLAMTQMEFGAGYAVLGLELAAPADFLVNTLTFRLQHLYEWLGITGFVRDPQNTLDHHLVTYRRPEDQAFVISPDLTLEIHSTHSFHPRRSEHIVREDLCLSFKSQKGLGLADCKELMGALRYLLHFATLAPVYMLSLDARKDGYGLTHDGHFYPHDIEIWNSIIREPAESDPRWVFRFPDVQPRFAALFATWLDFCRAYEEALRCYGTTVYHRLPDSIEHLCLTQALEAYHGAKFGRQRFVSRILALAQQFLPHLAGLVPDPAAFAEEVRDNRNYYTHHDPAIKQRGRVLSGAKLLRLNEKLRLIFQMCILTELGIPADRFAILRRQLASDIIDYI